MGENDWQRNDENDGQTDGWMRRGEEEDEAAAV